VKLERPRRLRLWPTGVWTGEGLGQSCGHGLADLHRLANLCDGAAGPSREIDQRIALAVSPSLRLLASVAPGVWAPPDGSHVSGPRYSSSTMATLTLVPGVRWIECNPRAAGRIEICGPDRSGENGWARNGDFPLAASAAALRALAGLAALRTTPVRRGTRAGACGSQGKSTDRTMPCRS
jgi:hypothetical protein